jgi:hypothetical protein
MEGGMKIDIKQRERDERREHGEVRREHDEPRREPRPDKPAEVEEEKAIDPRETVLSAHHQLDQALVLSDHDKVEKLVAKECRFVGPRGQDLDRDEWMAAHGSNRDQQVAIDTGGESVEVYGDAAVLVGHETAKLRFDKKVVESHFRVSQTWVKDGDDWKLASLQYTPVVEKKA